MALAAAEAIYNTAVNTLMAALETLVETKSQGDLVQFVPVERLKGDGEDTRFGQDANVVFNGLGVKEHIRLNLPTANPAAIPLAAGKHPMFWKITNSAGDLS